MSNSNTRESSPRSRRRPAKPPVAAIEASQTTPAHSTSARTLAKCPSGIRGLDQITKGGLPRGRSTLVCGAAGTGKTLFGLEFLARGALEYAEPGVFVSFEERLAELTENTASLDFKLKSLVARRKLVIDQVSIKRDEMLETGNYNLDGLFIRLGAAIASVKAKRVVLDTIEVLFASLSNREVLRSELRRLFKWLKDRRVTTVITSEIGTNQLTRDGLEEYVSDCVILLDERVKDQIATRRLRIVKYRGSTHGSNEYPFQIGERGIVVAPITHLALDYAAPKTFISSGVAGIDAMLDGGKGYFRGSMVMVSGGAGTGKSSLAAQFVDAACRRGERSLYFAFEESVQQLQRNMRSIGLDLKKWSQRGLLRFFAARPETFGLELHIGMLLKHIDEFDPRVVVLDPVSSLQSAGSLFDSRVLLMRVIDLLKTRGITTLFTSLSSDVDPTKQISVGVSSLVDSWILLRNLENHLEFTRGLHVVKARGMRHSNQVRELIITDRGLKLEDISMGPAGILVGSARLAQQAQDRFAALTSRQDVERMKRRLARTETMLKSHMARLTSNYSVKAHDIEQTIAETRARTAATAANRTRLAAQRERVTLHNGEHK